jgi:hypothetical protein
MRDFDDDDEAKLYERQRRAQWRDWRDFEISPWMQERARIEKECSRLCVEFQQNGEVVGVVEKKDFENSGEVGPPSALIVDMVQFFNAQPQNIKDGLTAHLILHTGPL